MSRPFAPARVGVLVSFLLAGCVAAAPSVVGSGDPRTAQWVEAPDTDDVVRLTIVGTNDVHGWIEPYARANGREGEPILGGTDIFASYLKVLRQKRPDGVVLLDAGDMFQGTLVANLTEGEAVIQAYNLLRYDAVALGNHEFDYGPEGAGVIATRPSEDPLGNIKRRMAEAMFPFLAANVTEKESGLAPPWKARDSIVIERKGVRIGIVGLSTPSTPLVTLAQNVAGLRFGGLAENAEKQARDLRSRGAQVVVVVMHAGGGCKIESDPTDPSGCDPNGELFQMIRELPPGTVDAVVAGHTHQFLSHFVGGVPAIQSSSFGVAFGMIDLWFDKKQGKVDTRRTAIAKPIPLCRKQFVTTRSCLKEADAPLEDVYFLGERIAPDAPIAEALRPAFKIVEKLKSEPLGPVLAAGFHRDRMRESEMGNLVTDIMRRSVPGTHVAVTNSGGLRADIDAGPVTYGKVFSALPFENKVVVMQLTGDELAAFLSLGTEGKHGILQVSGVRLEAVAPGSPPCNGRPRITHVAFDDGSPIDPTATYQVVTNDFVATGGDGFERVLGKVDPDRVTIRHDLPPIREVVASYMRAHPELSMPAQDPKPRLRFFKPTCEEPESPAAPATPAR
jgi:5'-nucleotidase